MLIAVMGNMLTNCSRCEGFIPARTTRCPNCDAKPPSRALRKAGQAAACGSAMMTLMACYGVPCDPDRDDCSYQDSQHEFGESYDLSCHDKATAIFANQTTKHEIPDTESASHSYCNDNSLPYPEAVVHLNPGSMAGLDVSIDVTIVSLNDTPLSFYVRTDCAQATPDDGSLLCRNLTTPVISSFNVIAYQGVDIIVDGPPGAFTIRTKIEKMSAP
jgi:hypothetical protein